jgi:hypothetical protein
MRISCEEIQTRLLDAAGDPAAQDNSELREHLESCPSCQAFWTALCRDDRLLTDYVAAVQPAVSRIETLVAGQLAEVELRPQDIHGDRWLWLSRSRLLKVAAAAVVAAGLWLLFGRGETTLYAQMMKALGNVRTMHVVDTDLREGQWQKRAEVWYDRRAGVVEMVWRDGKMVSRRIDDGKQAWTYEAGSDVAQRSRSMGVLRVVTDLMETSVFTEGALRVPAEDRTVAGTPWQAYSRSKDGTWCIVVWLDADKRVRAWEKRQLAQTGLWETYRRGTVEYDGTPEAALFQPDFGPAVRIVAVDSLLDDLFGLDKALFTKEALGFIFAVHEVKRCEGNMPYVVCSLRPTEETKRQVGYQGPAVWSYGSFTLGSSWRWVDANQTRDRCYQPLGLAHFYHDGLEVQSAFLVPLGAWPDRVTECELEVYISTPGGELRRQRVTQGLQTEARFKPMGTVPLPDAGTSAAQVLTDVYALARKLDAFVAFDRLTLKSVPFTDAEMEEYIRRYPESGESRRYRAGDKTSRLLHGVAKGVNQIGPEAWQKDRMQYLKDLLQQRK